MSPHPELRFTGDGRVAAVWEGSEWIFDRPGDLAAACVKVLPPLAGQTLELDTGREAVRRIFDTLPFLSEPPEAFLFAGGFTEPFKAAYSEIARPPALPNDIWFIRGEPDLFAVCAHRYRRQWTIAGVSSEPLILTTRLEDLWLRPGCPPPPDTVDIRLFRNPNALEDKTERAIEEVFPDCPPDTKVVLELPVNGGFLIKIAGGE